MDNLSLVEFLILGLAAFRVTHLLLSDVIAEGLRERVWKRFPPESTKIGYLFTCPWCLGFWVSTAIGISYILIPMVTVPVALIFALSAVAGIISTRLDR